MSPINKNTNLRISISLKIKICNASSKFDGSIFLYACKPIRTNIICISNHQTTGIKTFGICKFLFNASSILIEFIIFDCGNIIPLKSSIFRTSRRAEDHLSGKIYGVVRLRNSVLPNNVSFRLKSI